MTIIEALLREVLVDVGLHQKATRTIRDDGGWALLVFTMRRVLAAVAGQRAPQLAA